MGIVDSCSHLSPTRVYHHLATGMDAERSATTRLKDAPPWFTARPHATFSTPPILQTGGCMPRGMYGKFTGRSVPRVIDVLRLKCHGTVN